MTEVTCESMDCETGHSNLTWSCQTERSLLRYSCRRKESHSPKLCHYDNMIDGNTNISDVSMTADNHLTFVTRVVLLACVIIYKIVTRFRRASDGK